MDEWIFFSMDLLCDIFLTGRRMLASAVFPMESTSGWVRKEKTKEKKSFILLSQHSQKKLILSRQVHFEESWTVSGVAKSVREFFVSNVNTFLVSNCLVSLSLGAS